MRLYVYITYKYRKYYIHIKNLAQFLPKRKYSVNVSYHQIFL